MCFDGQALFDLSLCPLFFSIHNLHFLPMDDMSCHFPSCGRFSATFLFWFTDDSSACLSRGSNDCASGTDKLDSSVDKLS